MKLGISLLLSLVLSSTPLLSYEVQQTHKKLSDTEQEIQLTFILGDQEYLYKEFLLPSVNNPDVTLSPFTTTTKSVTFFDEGYQKQKEGYTGTVTFTGKATIKSDALLPKALVHTHFMVTSDKQPHEETTELTFTLPEKPATVIPKATPIKKPAPQSPPVECAPQQPSLVGNLIQKSLNYISVTVTQTKQTLTGLFSTTGSKLLRFLAALLLGILLSLTPCIYPMIPITIGVLQASGTKSGWENFKLALSYTMGISTTFALLGFVAAIGSCVFGELQGSPYIVIPLALVLLFFGLTMFDLVQMPIPSWLQPKTSSVKGGSKKSAFIFGALSGTVASPCLSPGLVLILNYVAKISTVSIGAYFEGFLLLFIFGIGSSLPLLIIGTFSGSLKMLPKAGAWMIEIKKLIGIMLIAMALYHLSHLERLVPWYIFVWVIVLVFILLGTYYFYTIKRYDTTGMKRYKNTMGVSLIVVGTILGVQGEKALLEHLFPEEVKQVWAHSYQSSLEQARKKNKLLFIDIGASYCASCKVLDEQIFAQEMIQDALALFTLLKIESDVDTKAYNEVKKQYKKYIVGFPTYLVVDPKTEEVVKKWTIDIDQLSLEGIEQELRKLAESYT